MKSRTLAGGAPAVQLPASPGAIKVGVEAEFCIGCGHCGETAPGNLRLDRVARHSVVIKQPENEEETRACIAAADSCPTGALQAIEGD